MNEDDPLLLHILHVLYVFITLFTVKKKNKHTLDMLRYFQVVIPSEEKIACLRRGLIRISNTSSQKIW